MPRLGIKGREAIDARTAFQTMHMLEGVITRGTATNLRSLVLPLFGKTGTTTGPKDVWFVGGTQKLIAGVYVGFDSPRNMGGWAYGGTIAAPIIKDLIETSRDSWEALPPIAPDGIQMVRVNRRTGKRVLDGWPDGDPRGDIIWEAFKPDSEPERSTRQDLIAAKRDEILALIRAGREGDAFIRRDGEVENFAEEQGGIY